MKTKLARVQVLYRQADTLSLWGLPYRMRPGQQPRDIRTEYRTDWIWLGCPGWWYTMPKEDQAAVQEFVAKLGDLVPNGPNEWSDLSEQAILSDSHNCHPSA